MKKKDLKETILKLSNKNKLTNEDLKNVKGGYKGDGTLEHPYELEEVVVTPNN